LLQLLLD
jgi:hypothetical protein